MIKSDFMMPPYVRDRNIFGDIALKVHTLESPPTRVILRVAKGKKPNMLTNSGISYFVLHQIKL